MQKSLRNAVSPRWKTMLLVLVIVPFWTSILIRSYAWIFLLGGKGLPALLATFGFEDIRMLNGPFAVLVGIVYGYLPLMVFPIYVALEKLDLDIKKIATAHNARIFTMKEMKASVAAYAPVGCANDRPVCR